VHRQPRAELPEACLNKILLLRRSERSDEFGLLSDESLLIPIEGAVGGDVFVSRNFLGRIPVDDAAALFLKRPELARHAGELSSRF
jgi:hypothetical protein